MKADCENIKPYHGKHDSSKREEVREMFDNIAPKYDFMNRAMTFGLDNSWRNKAIRKVADSGSKKVLDIACGTGDMAIKMAKSIPGISITGIDLSPKMLEEGRRKVEREHLQERIVLIEGDSLALPFDDESFDAITVAFGVRNFENLEKGYREMCRVLKRHGLLIVLELSTPQGALTGAAYRFYTKYLIPLAGKMISGDSRAYSYLPESIAAVPQREGMSSLIKASGFSDVSYSEMTFGTCSLYVGRK